MTGPEVRSSEFLTLWWKGDASGQRLYRRLRSVTTGQWRAALAALPTDPGPAVLPPPDKPPPRIADLPEIQALRAAFQDRRVPFDTTERWIRSLTMGAQAIAGKRPLEWSADDVAARCVALAAGAEGSLWSTLEAVRELWAWHPDRSYGERQAARLLEFLRCAVGAATEEENAP